MASTYSDLKIELIGTGEQVGTWGNTTNTNLGTALGEAITGSANVTFSSADVTITLTDTNASQTARNLRLVCTGTSGGARNLILGSGCQIEKLYLIQNDLADTVTVKNTTGTGVAVPAGGKQFVFNDGTNVVEASSVTGTLPVANGGTGQTSYTNGQLLIGNTTGNTLTKATLTGTANRLLVTNGAGSITLNVDATNANTANKVVARDGSGNFSAGTITATLSGSAASLTTARTINGTSFNGTANITTANWGTARTIWGNSINGSGNITAPVRPAAGSAAAPAFSTSGDTNTGIWFSSADTISFVCGGTADFRVDGTGQLWNTVQSQVGADYTTLHKGYFARAWVNFNGTGTVAIRASGNVTSITDNGTGDYTVNFTTAMPDANYSAVLSTSNDSNGNWRVIMQWNQGVARTTSAIRMISAGTDFSQNPAGTDFSYVDVAIFR